jgi:hypothetical protein
MQNLFDLLSVHIQSNQEQKMIGRHIRVLLDATLCIRHALHTTDKEIFAIDDTGLRPRSLPMHTPNISFSTHHIESLDACMKH